MKRNNPYDPIYVSKRDNISIEEAEVKISDLKKRTAVSKELLINKYGLEDGEKRYKEFIEKSKQTKDNYKKRYGDNWETKWNETCKKHDCSSLEYFVKKYGLIEGEKKFKEKNEKSLINYQKFLEKYKDPIIADKEYKRYITKKTIKLQNHTSKESLDFLNPVLNFLKLNNILYFCGDIDNKEYYLWDSLSKRRYFYDLVIPELRICFEYDGISHYHPSQDKEKWICVYRKISWKQACDFDKYKQSLIEAKGYKVIRYHYIDLKNKVEFYQKQLLEIISENYKNYKT